MNFDTIEISLGLEIHKQICKLELEQFQNRTKLVQKYFTSFGDNNFQLNPKKNEIKSILRCEKINNKFILRKNNYFKSSNDLYKLDEAPPVFNNFILCLCKRLCNILNLQINYKSFIMRKHVYDGSIPTGFQRTILISNPDNNELIYDLPIKEVYLEEDSSKIKNKKLDTTRCSIGLFEIVTNPIFLKIKDISTVITNIKKFNFFLDQKLCLESFQGSIRQDINFKYKNSLLEIKGLDKLENTEKLIKYEILRLDKLENEITNFKNEVNKELTPELFIDCINFHKVNNFYYVVKNNKLISKNLNLILENYLKYDFSSTRGSITDTLTEFKRLKQGCSRMHVETDLEPVTWENISNRPFIDYTKQYEYLGLIQKNKFPKNETLLNFFKQKINSNNLGFLNFFNSNFEKLCNVSKNIYKLLSLILKKYEENLIDLSYLQENLSNDLLKKVSRVNKQKLIKIIKQAKLEELSLKEVFKKFKGEISSKKFLTQYFNNLFI